jgi:hypothetical protein
MDEAHFEVHASCHPDPLCSLTDTCSNRTSFTLALSRPTLLFCRMDWILRSVKRRVKDHGIVYLQKTYVFFMSFQGVNLSGGQRARVCLARAVYLFVSHCIIALVLSPATDIVCFLQRCRHHPPRRPCSFFTYPLCFAHNRA